MFTHMVGRIPVMDVTPIVEAGRFPAKATVGEPLAVSAVVFREGHDLLGAEVVLTGPDGRKRPPTRMREQPEGVDVWAAEVTPDAVGQWSFHIQAWGDPIATWRHNAEIKVPAGIDVELMFKEGALLLKRAAAARCSPTRSRRSATRPDPRRSATAPRSPPPSTPCSMNTRCATW
jgi:starch synthase (maltosyl-transferring)